MTTPDKTVLIGTRGSELALCQAREVQARLQEAYPDTRFDISIVATGGDQRPDAPIEQLGLGAFVKELQAALLRGDVDLAVHSLKDVPTAQAPGLAIAALTRREDPSDALVDRWDMPLEKLPTGARIGTGSPRRAAQLKQLRPDIQVLPIRGNVTTRVEKAHGDNFDGVVVALSGLRRLGLEDRAAQVFACDEIVPAPGQGALAIEVREGDERVASLVRALQHPATAAAVKAERALLAHLGGGCRAPFGAYAFMEDDKLTLTGLLAAEGGAPVYRATATGSVSDPDALANEAYRQFMDQGAASVLGAAGESR